VDVLSYFGLSLFIAEEELIVSWISAIIEHPVIARMISIFLNLHTSINDTELRRSSDKEHEGFICGTFIVWVNKVNKGWYPS
jgi:hypothetical protein